MQQENQGQNPFASMVEGFDPASFMAGRQSAQNGSQMNGEQEMEEENPQLVAGSNPSPSRFLSGAIKQLENYLKESTDKDEVATARSVIVLLTRLISKDQERMVKQLG